MLHHQQLNGELNKIFFKGDWETEEKLLCYAIKLNEIFSRVIYMGHFFKKVCLQISEFVWGFYFKIKIQMATKVLTWKNVKKGKNKM